MKKEIIVIVFGIVIIPILNYILFGKSEVDLYYIVIINVGLGFLLKMLWGCKDEN
jgi:hypothetical protein